MADTKPGSIRNVLSVDVEDYFHVEAFAARVSQAQWPGFAPRVEANVQRVLDLFDDARVRGTFFVLGWVAERYPALVREIARRGHEVGCHGAMHQHVRRLTADGFRADVCKARRLLIELAGQPVCCYRAPSFSIVRETLWALDVLAEEGFTADSSIFAVRHDNYGIPNAPRFPHWLTTPSGNRLFEFPPSTVRLLGNNVGIAGGGYLRLAPYYLTKRAIRYVNTKDQQPVMVYFHPWEIDPGQPRIQAPLRSRLRHYTNLAGMEQKIRRLVREFQFTTLSDYVAATASGKVS
jgi:polysaccharide deacetylase family protein (PEP-CTERM system associated)